MSAVRILQQQIPFARSILWAPTSATRPVEAAYPVFLLQSALQAIYEHLSTVPPAGQGVLGFLLGDRCECPVTGVSFSVIDAALRLNQTIYGDRTRDVVTRLWKRLDAQLEEQQAHLIGWYHTHAPLPLELSAHDVETQELYFNEPWQVGMLVGTDAATPAGAFFTVGPDAPWVRTAQPFYELLNEDSIRPGGKKRSFITWKNYRAYNPPGLQVRAAQAPAAARPSQPHAPAPQEDAGEDQPAPEEAGRDTAGMENLPQAELEEPRRVELEPPPPSAPPEPARAAEAEEAEEPEDWEDVGALRFLTAAEDSPPPAPPVPPRAPPTPPPPPPAPVAYEEADSGWQEPALEDTPAEELPAEEPPAEEPPAEPSPRPRPARRKAKRRGSRGWRQILTRVTMVGRVGIVLVIGGVAAWQLGPSLMRGVRAVAPGNPGPPKGNPPPVAAPRSAAPRPTRAPRAELALLDQAGDTLARALQVYDGRMRLFEKRQLDCWGLARGMLRVERAVSNYGAQRNATRATLDAGRVAWDRQLRAGADTAGRQFQRSQCER